MIGGPIEGKGGVVDKVTLLFFVAGAALVAGDRAFVDHVAIDGGETDVATGDDPASLVGQVVARAGSSNAASTCNRC